MPTESFSAIDDATLEAPTGAFNPLTGTTSETPDRGTLATTPDRQIAAAPDLSGTGIEGEVRRQDINIPKLTLVNDMSRARKEGDAALGSFMFADTVCLVKPTKGAAKSDSIDIFVLALRKSYQQKVDFGSDIKPARANTAAEVRELGGTVDRRDKTKVLFEEMAEILVLLPQPPDVDEADEAYFYNEINGRPYAKALFFVKSFAYTNVAKPIITRVNNTGGKIIDTTYSLHSEFIKTDTFSWWTPKLRAGRLTTPEEREWLAAKQVS